MQTRNDIRAAGEGVGRGLARQPAVFRRLERARAALTPELTQTQHFILKSTNIRCYYDTIFHLIRGFER